MSVVAATFATVFGLIVLGYWLFVLRQEEQAQGSLQRRLRRDPVRRKARLDVLKMTQPLSNIKFLDGLLKRFGGVTRPLRGLMDVAGVKMTPGLFILMTGVCSLTAYLIVAHFVPFRVIPPIAALLAGTIPYLYVRRARDVRLAKFEEQFPDAIDLIGRALRAGHAFTTGLGMVSDEVPDPVGSEFRMLYEHQNFGLALPDALRLFAQRVPLLDARFFATAVLTQRESGGNLSEILDNLANVIRERFKVKRQVRSVSAHARLTGWILMALPPVMAIAFFVIVPDTIRTLVTDPLGIRMVVGAAVLQIVGSLVIRKIVNIEY